MCAMLVCRGMCVEIREQRSEVILLFPHVGLGNRTQVINLDSTHLYLVSHLTGPGLSIFEERQKKISVFPSQTILETHRAYTL